MAKLSILDLVRVTEQTSAREALDNARDVAATLAKALAAASTQPSVTSVPAGAGNDGAVRTEPGRGMAVA